MEEKQAKRFDILLLCIALLSAFLNIFNIWKEQYANAYYTAAVTSMLQSFHNFFFASFDPGGFVSVDKPPVTFWVQTIFAYIFGVHGWSVILPQALAGVGSVLLIYYLVKPTFGKAAARLASLVIACTPIAVAVSRTNNIDSMLVFTLLLATWMLFRAVRTQKVGWVLGAFAMIGLGFNMKMLQAYMVVPAFFVFYLLAFRHAWKKKLATLAIASVVLAGVSLSWAVVVDYMVPASARPYVGGSQTNSVLELALGYNGVSRLTGMNRGGGGAGAPTAGEMPGAPDTSVRERDGQQGFMPGPGDAEQQGAPGAMPRFEGGQAPERGSNGMFGGNQPGRGSSGMFGTGQAGPLRLFQSELSGQASWLLPLVAFASVGLLAGIRRKKPLTDKENETLFWLAWLLPVAAFFSVAGFFHQYYLIMLAPPIAALVGAGWVELWNQYQTKDGWKMWLMPAALLATTAFELYILVPYQQQIGQGWSLIGAAGIGTALVLFFAARRPKLSPVVALVGILALLVGPLYWSATPILYGDNSMLPQAGPSQMGSNMGGFGGGPQGLAELPQNVGGNQKNAGGGQRDSVNTELLDYLIQHNTGETFLFATTDAGTAEPYIIQTGRAVMAMGGFSGSDPILTMDKLQQLVETKQVKYFLISSGGGAGGPSGGGSSSVLEWIRWHGTQVPSSEWQGTSEQGDSNGMREGNTLYEVNP